jgi:BNR repeat-like domain
VTFRFLICLLVILSAQVAVARRSEPDTAQLVASGSEPALAADDSGSVCAVCVGRSSGQLMFTQSTSAALTWAEPIVVAKLEGECSHPDIAAKSNGATYVVWSNALLPKVEGEIMFAHSDDHGKTWSTPVNISNTQTSSTQPALALGPDNSLQVIWREALSDGQVDVVCSSSTDGGQTWSKVEVVTKGSGSVDEPSISVSADGTLHAAWLDSDRTRATKDVYYASKAAGNWTAAVNLSASSKKCDHPRVVCGGKAKTFVAWAENDGQSNNVWCAVSNRRGGFTKIVITDGPGEARDVSLSADSVGKVAVVWSSMNGSGNGGPRGRISRDAFDEISNVMALAKSSSDSRHCAVAVSGRQMVALWEEGEKAQSVLKSFSLNFSDVPTGPATSSEVAIHPHHGY